MKKLILLLPLLLFLGCEDEATTPDIDTILTGTWNVTGLGSYPDANCTGTPDNTSWALAQAFGISMTFIFHADGTVDMTTTVFGDSDTQTLDWTADNTELCIDSECVTYTLSNDNKALSFHGVVEAYCIDANDDEVALGETACGEAGYDWNDAVCYLYSMAKQ